MNIHEIPFVALAGIRINPQGLLVQPFDEHTKNHLGTMHAGIQFSLAETASGFYLQQRFPELADHVIPVLRESKIKYRRPVTGEITANASVSEAVCDQFVHRLSTRGRSSIEVYVALQDKAGTQVCSGQFIWFVQKDLRS